MTKKKLTWKDLSLDDFKVYFFSLFKAFIPKKKIKTAIKNCSAENMRQRDEDLEKHIRKASVGDWRNHLGEKHLEIIRAKHAERINQLGYSVH